MRLKLGGRNSHHFKFKIGDKVRSKYGPSTGIVMDGDCYPDSGPNIVFYTVKTLNGLTQTYRQDDIELLQIKLSSNIEKRASG